MTNKIERWTERLEVKPTNTAEEIESAMQAEITELRRTLEAALKECRNTTLEEAAVPITEFPQSFRDDLAEAIRQGKVTIS